MAIIADSARKRLKKPLGRVYASGGPIARLARANRIISVGDACTLALLDAGVRPFLAVFDLKCMRRKMDGRSIKRLLAEFPKQRTYRNPAGTLSGRLVGDAPMLLAKGGAVRIIGEEDLTALAFIMAAGRKDVIVYGQPGKGMVAVRPGRKLAVMIGRLLSAKK